MLAHGLLLRLVATRLRTGPLGGRLGAGDLDMLGYYLQLAFRSLRRNPVLTSLMITAVGVGIGASMTMLTNLRVMTGDPIPIWTRGLRLPTCA